MHLLIIGPTRSGKGNFVNTKALEWFKEGHWITYAAPHAYIALMFLAELYAYLGNALFKRPILVERLSDVDRVIMRSYVRTSTASGLERMRENDEFAWAVMGILARRRGLTNLEDRPVLEKYAFLAIRLYQEQDEWCPEWWIPHSLDPRSAIAKHMLRHCLSPEIRAEFEKMRSFPMREQLQLLDPAKRLLSGIYSKPPIIGRTSWPATMNWTDFRAAGGVYIILGGDVSDDAFRMHVCSDFQQTVFDAKKGNTRQGVYIFDEVNNYTLWSDFESHCLSTVAHLGISMCGQVQSFDFPSIEIFNNVKNNTNRVWMPQLDFDMAKIAAHDLLGMLSRDKIHHIEKNKRQVNKGFREERHVLKGISKGEHGDSESERESINMIPILETEIDERPVYETANDQMMWQAQRIMELPIGSAMVREAHRKPYTLKVPLLKDSWVFPGLAERKVEECIERIKQRPEYETPEIRWPEPPTTPLQRNATKKGGRG